MECSFSCYERLAPRVVPQSALKLPLSEDKDGNTLYRVVMFKSSLETFRNELKNVNGGQVKKPHSKRVKKTTLETSEYINYARNE